MSGIYQDLKPYVGVDYVYDHADVKGNAKHVDKNFNTAKINVGLQTTKYASIEAFYQFDAERKGKNRENKREKLKYNAYGLDLYGYLPLGCDQTFSLLGTTGLAIYDTDFKETGRKHHDASRVGYRVGGGAQYNLTENLAARVIGRYSYIGTKDLNHLAEVTAGLRYAF